jgi:hypothetical protein
MPAVQLNMLEGIREKDAGLLRAVTSANDKCPGWSEKAYTMFCEWLAGWPSGFSFLIEDFRVSASARGLPDPNSKRAFGFIPCKAAKAGLIKQEGTGKVKNKDAHRCNAGRWIKI